MLPALSGPTSTGCPPFVTLPRDPAVTTLATSRTLNGHWHGAVVAALVRADLLGWQERRDGVMDWRQIDIGRD